MKLCNRIIEYSFYALFFLVPLIFYGSTSELFEFNKMWITFGITIIVSTAWIYKMIFQRHIAIQKTPLDIPILLFLLSQIISTIFSLDQHISWWGYYSRFNGGLLSIISYILLYYAFVSNVQKEQILKILKILKISLLAGFFVALWGFPAHFGYDPTCFVFRGNFDVSCWTAAFKPTIRTFSTLGQPAWYAAYVATLLPLAIAYALKNATFQFLKTQQSQKTNNQHIKHVFGIWNVKFGMYTALAVLFYLSLTFANTRAGFIAFITADSIFWVLLFFKRLFSRQVLFTAFITIHILFLLSNFLFGFPIENLNKTTLPSLIRQTITTQPTETAKQIQQATPEASVSTGANITDSGTIRLFVWQGALNAWKAHPLFGTGVETFAFAYYQYKPKGHNLTSEWDYLYNKAHNEYLNYLTTTGIFGLGTYLWMIGLFLFLTSKWLMKNGKALSAKSEEKKITSSQPTTFRLLLVTGLLAGYISILVSNFFGFSVVIINLYFFLIPAFVFILTEMLPKKQITLPSTLEPKPYPLSPNLYQWTGIIFLILISSWLLIGLIRYWQADVAYALGTNLDHVGQYQSAYEPLTTSVQIEPNEPVYTDELAINLAVLSTALATQQEATTAAQFANKAIELNTSIVTKHPNNIVFWKNRVRLFYTLAQADEQNSSLYYNEALQAIEKAHTLSPNDAKISYNLGVLYGQTGDIKKGIGTLQETIKLKPDYRDAYFALGLFYHEEGQKQKAIDTYDYILKHISQNDEEVIKSIKEWGS